mmetsp:Transcript_1896/g.3597  ORF Transcript_1896/g.3597 Transcript_1896/m.3597 type:complete len:237 (-) Transcript_1896:1867-2577(-)
MQTLLQPLRETGHHIIHSWLLLFLLLLILLLLTMVLTILIDFRSYIFYLTLQHMSAINRIHSFHGSPNPLRCSLLLIYSTSKPFRQQLHHIFIVVILFRREIEFGSTDCLVRSYLIGCRSFSFVLCIVTDNTFFITLGQKHINFFIDTFIVVAFIIFLSRRFLLLQSAFCFCFMWSSIGSSHRSSVGITKVLVELFRKKMNRIRCRKIEILIFIFHKSFQFFFQLLNFTIYFFHHI